MSFRQHQEVDRKSCGKYLMAFTYPIFTPTVLVCSFNPMAVLCFALALWLLSRLELPYTCLGVSSAQIIPSVGWTVKPAQHLPYFRSTAIPLDSGGCRFALPNLPPSETTISLRPQSTSLGPSTSFPMPPDPLLATHYLPFSFLGDGGVPCWSVRHRTMAFQVERCKLQLISEEYTGCIGFRNGFLNDGWNLT
jgi:hypothetical protein